MGRERLLLVEDEDGIRGLIQLYLENQGYQVCSVDNGEAALEQMDDSVDLILLDIEMPRMNGYEVCRKIRENYNTPIIFISSRREIVDKIKSLELGGDDYITKPFDFEELVARIKANIRRYSSHQGKEAVNKLVYKNLVIYLDRFECFLNGEFIALSAREMEILIVLATHPNQVWSSEQLYDHIWGFNSSGDVQTIKVHISNLRRKIERNIRNPEYIKTVRGFGYKFSKS